jgi:hypothetical protein
LPSAQARETALAVPPAKAIISYFSCTSVSLRFAIAEKTTDKAVTN